MKILVIEDDDIVRDAIFAMLTYKKHDIDLTT